MIFPKLLRNSQGILESLEFLLKSGFIPKRSFYLAFGHDEEGSGYEGAAAMADILKSRLKVSKSSSKVSRDISEEAKDENVSVQGSLLYLLDEGSIILKGSSFPGITSSVAL